MAWNVVQTIGQVLYIASSMSSQLSSAVLALAGSRWLWVFDAQVLGYMSRRGHSYGAISTFFHTYMLHVPLRRGDEVLVQISAGIPHNASGSPDQLSVTEVSSWLIGMYI